MKAQPLADRTRHLVEHRHQRRPVRPAVERAEKQRQMVRVVEIIHLRQREDAVAEHLDFRVLRAQRLGQRRRAGLDRMHAAEGQQLVEVDAAVLHELRMVVKLADDHIILLQQGAQPREARFAQQQRPVQHRDARRVGQAGVQLRLAGDGAEQCAVGPHRADRLDDPHIAHPALRRQHGGVQLDASLRRFAGAPDELQRHRAVEIFRRVDAQRLQRGRDRGDELLRLLARDRPGGDIGELQPGIGQGLAHHARGEPAQMRAVEQPLLLITEIAGQQPGGKGPVLDIGHADQHGALGREIFRVFGQQRPGFDQMLQHIAVDDAVNPLGHVEGHRVLFNVAAEHLGNPLPGMGGGLGVYVDPQHPRPGVAAQIVSAKRPLGAADIKNRARRERNFFEQFGIGEIGIMRVSGVL